jgi:hypothetical protein
LDDLLSRQHGALLAHLRAAGVSVEMAASRWLMCLFITVLPLRTATLLWDLMLLDAAAKAGPSSVPLLGCLGLLQLHEPRLLSTPQHSSALLPLLVQLPSLASPAQCDALLEWLSRFVASAAYGTDLLQEQIAPLRAAHARVVAAELSHLEAEATGAEATGAQAKGARRGADGGGAPAPADESLSEASFSSDSGRPRTRHGVAARPPAAASSSGAAPPAGAAEARKGGLAADAMAGGAGWLREQAALLQREGEAVRSAALMESAAAATELSKLWAPMR